MPSFIVEKVTKRETFDVSIIKERDQNDSLSFLDVAGNLVNPTQVLIDSNELKNSLLNASFIRSQSLDDSQLSDKLSLAKVKPVQPKFPVFKTPGLDNSDEEMSEGILR